MGRKPIGGIFSVGVEEPYRWKDSVQNGPEIRLWALDGIANGLRPWFTKFSGTLHDKRWLPVVEDLYGWLYRNERYLRNESPLARVGLVYSQQTYRYYGAPQARQKVEDHSLGYYQALIEARIPFEMVHDQLLDKPKFKALILPNIAALSTGQCEQLRAFAACGAPISGWRISMAPHTLGRWTCACRTPTCGWSRRGTRCWRAWRTPSA